MLGFFAGAAFFSGAAIAYFSLGENQIRELKKSKSSNAKRIRDMLKNQYLLFVALKLGTWSFYLLSLLTGIALVNVISTAQLLSFQLSSIALVAVFSVVLFFISEIWAKLFVLAHNRSDVQRISPLTSSYKARGMGGRAQPKTEIEEKERELIHSIYEFGDAEVHEIMVPRTDIISAEANTSVEQLLKLIGNKGHSRIPLYHEDVDKILGIVHIKDLLLVMSNPDKKPVALQELVRPAYFVPESKPLHDLLREFQKEKHHMAIVVDEYGGTAGLVTLEDVLEEIVGDIQDEYDQEPPLYRKLDENTFSIDAKIDLRELNEQLGFDLPTEGEYESLGGFILTLTGYVPEEKEIVTYGNYSFAIETVERNRIIRVKLSRTITDPSDSDDMAEPSPDQELENNGPN
jgi:CBS domain containing-hemolysin-like protein